MEDKHEEVEDIESGLSDSFIDDDDEDSNNDDDNEPSTSGQDDGTRIQVFFVALCFLLVTVKCYLSPLLIGKYTIFFLCECYYFWILVL
jgi:hypothetical protein